MRIFAKFGEGGENSRGGGELRGYYGIVRALINRVRLPILLVKINISLSAYALYGWAAVNAMATRLALPDILGTDPMAVEMDAIGGS